MAKKKKRNRGRPPVLVWPEPIDASPDEIAEVALRVPHKKEWRFLQEPTEETETNEG